MKVEDLQVCDIILYKGTNWDSWFIRFLTWSRYSHVAVVVSPKEHLAIESKMGTQGGVHLFHLGKLATIEADVFRVKPEYPFDREKVIEHLKSRIGARYDYIGMIWLGVLKFISLLCFLQVRFHNRFQRERDYFCSELCYEAFLKGGVDIVPQIHESHITSPADIARSPVLEKVPSTLAKKEPGS